MAAPFVQVSGTGRRAAELTWIEFQRRIRTEPVVLAIGSFEQHGPHLPLATDAIIAEALADEITERIDGLFLPVVSYGAPSRPLSGGGDLFPAPDVTLPTLFSALGSITRGLVDAGARRLVVFTWHYENAAVLWDALKETITARSGAKAVIFSAPWDLLDAQSLAAVFPGGGEVDWAADHAGLLETAIMKHLAPELVGEAPSPEPFARRSYDVLPTPRDAVPDSGVVNDARRVTADGGRLALTVMADAMANAAGREL